MSTHTIPKIDAELRDRLGSRYAARLRETGRLPAVVYGHKKDPIHICVDNKTFYDIVQHQAHLLEVVIDGRGESCLIKDVQWNHLGDQIVHLDLTRVDLSEEVEVEVELIITGEPKELKEGGKILEHPVSMLEVKCRADAIPNQIELDVSELTSEEPITVADLKLPPGVVAVTDAETILAQIQEVREVEEEVEVAAEAAADEPEIIGRDKEAEGEAEGEAAEAKKEKG